MNHLMKTQKNIEKAVVGGYKTIQTGVVTSYKKIEKKFVDAFLTPDEETETGDGAQKRG